MTVKNIALFGGTFDPVHLGHTAVASALEQFGIDKIVFIPTKRSPLKTASPYASDNDRLAMITLAIDGHEKFELSGYEIKKPEPSYTLETVRYFKTLYGGESEICWLMGADSLGDLRRWYKIVELIDECKICTMYRAGFEPPDFSKFEIAWGPSRVEKLQNNIVPTPLIDISSTEVRKRLAAGESVDGLLHPDVIRYIEDRKLYR